MKNYKRFIVPVLLCAVVLVTGGFYFYHNQEKLSNPERFVQEKAAYLRLIQDSSEIHSLWEAGEESREWSLIKLNCLKKYGITQKFDKSLLRCNPLLLQCHAEFSKNLSYKILNVDGYYNSFYRIMTKSNSSYQGLRVNGVALTIEDIQSGNKIDLFLTDQCH